MHGSVKPDEAPPSAPHQRSGWASPWPPVTALLALSTAFIARASFETTQGRTFTLFDDAMVSMRFARNLAEGHGLVYNARGPRVEGYTNFLWTLWMALLHLAPVPTRLVPLLVSVSGVALLVAGVILVGAIARRLAPDVPAVAAVAMWSTALYYPLLFWTLRGLEPGLLAVVIEGAVLLAWRLRDDPRRSTAAGLAGLLVVGVLTRTDFVLVAAVVVGWLIWPGQARATRRRALAVGSTVAVALLAHTAFRLAYYGNALPNTFTLKLGGVPIDTRLGRGSAALGELLLAETAVVLVLAIVALGTRRWRTAPVALLAAVVAIAALYSVYVGGDAWEYLEYANRYLTPVMPLLLVLAAIGAAEIVSWRTAPARLGLLALGIIAVGATVGANALGPDSDNLRNSSNLADLIHEHWLALVGALALLTVAALLLAAPRRSGLALVAVAGALILMVSMPAWAEWDRDAGHLVRQNEYETRVGLALGAIARGKPAVAVVAAGTIPYWSELPAVDLLGKSDAAIAHGPNRGPGFLPGHSKWNYRYSICGQRPALVAQLFEPTRADRRLISACGYTGVWDDVYVRNDQTGFPRQALARVVFETKP